MSGDSPPDLSSVSTGAVRLQFEAALAAQVQRVRESPDSGESALLSGHVVDIHLLPQADGGVRDQDLPYGGVAFPSRVTLDSGVQGIFKPTVLPPDVPRRAHFTSSHEFDPELGVLNELGTRQLAYRLGDPWRSLVPATVLRAVRGQLGSVQLWRAGQTGFPGAGVPRPRGWAEAAFFDELAGNPDRHDANVLIDNPPGRPAAMTLPDGGGAFQLTDRVHSQWPIARERHTFHPGLTHQERRVLWRLLGSPGLLEVGPIIGARRAAALRERGTRMLSRDTGGGFGLVSPRGAVRAIKRRGGAGGTLPPLQTGDTAGPELDH